MTKRWHIIISVLLALIGIFVADPMNSPVQGQGGSWFCEEVSLELVRFRCFWL